jgi:hypothetical protein
MATSIAAKRLAKAPGCKFAAAKLLKAQGSKTDPEKVVQICTTFFGLPPQYNEGILKGG